jgi:hypothetical protein
MLLGNEFSTPAFMSSKLRALLFFSLLLGACYGKAEVDANQIVEWLNQGKYDELDRAAEKYRSKPTSPYDYKCDLGEFYGSFPVLKESDSDLEWNAYKDKLDAWRKAKPDSVAAAVKLAEYYGDLAWKRRGHAYSKDVTQQGWQGYRENTYNAANILREPAMRTATDP